MCPECTSTKNLSIDNDRIINFIDILFNFISRYTKFCHVFPKNKLYATRKLHLRNGKIISSSEIIR